MNESFYWDRITAKEAKTKRNEVEMFHDESGLFVQHFAFGVLKKNK